jgi:D-alanyl-D-alanine carboxypeptidase
VSRVIALVVALALTGASYDEALQGSREKSGATQMAGAVLRDGRLVWTGAVGEGAQASDVYSLASLSKTYTATLVLQLARRGRLPLGAHISRWLRGRIPAAAGRVTVRELLNHTSGLPDYVDDPKINVSFGDPRHRWTEAELLRAVRAPRHRGKFAYSNTNFILLGAILRRVTRAPVDRLLVEQVLTPLGLTSTSMARVGRLARRVAGHRRLPNDIWDELFADGSVVASAADVARFLDGLLVSRSLLDATWLQRMLAGAKPGERGYGFGIYGVSIGGRIVYGHDGSYGGWESYGVSDQASGMTYVVLAHGGSAGGPTVGVAALTEAG